MFREVKDRSDAPWADSLVQLLPPRGRDKGIVVLQAYFDESGIHEGAAICVIAGWLGSTARWGEFERKWARRPDHEMPFHAKRFFARDGDGQRVSPYDGWSDERAKAYFKGIGETVLNADIQPLVAAIDVRSFRAYPIEKRRFLTGGGWDKRNKKRLTGAPNSPYFLPFQAVVVESLRRLTRPDWKVHFAFDEQNSYAPFALKLYHYLKNDHEDPWSDRMGSAIFMTRLEAPALQAADLLAHCWYQVLVNGKDGIRAAANTEINGFLGWSEIAKQYEAQFFSREVMDKLHGDAPAVTGRRYVV